MICLILPTVKKNIAGILFFKIKYNIINTSNGQKNIMLIFYSFKMNTTLLILPTHKFNADTFIFNYNTFVSPQKTKTILLSVNIFFK